MKIDQISKCYRFSRYNKKIWLSNLIIRLIILDLPLFFSNFNTCFLVSRLFIVNIWHWKCYLYVWQCTHKLFSILYCALSSDCKKKVSVITSGYMIRWFENALNFVILFSFWQERKLVLVSIRSRTGTS